MSQRRLPLVGVAAQNLWAIINIELYDWSRAYTYECIAETMPSTCKRSHILPCTSRGVECGRMLARHSTSLLLPRTAAAVLQAALTGQEVAPTALKEGKNPTETTNRGQIHSTAPRGGTTTAITTTTSRGFQHCNTNLITLPQQGYRGCSSIPKETPLAVHGSKRGVAWPTAHQSHCFTGCCTDTPEGPTPSSIHHGLLGGVQTKEGITNLQRTES